MKKSNQMSNSNEVVVTGIGIVSSIGKTIPEFKDAIYNGRCGIDYLSDNDNLCMPNLGALIKDFSFEKSLNSYKLLEKNEEIVKNAAKCARRSGALLQAAVISSLEAWHNANLPNNLIQPDRIGLVVAGSNLGQNLQFNMHHKFKETPEYIPPTYALQYLDTDYVGTLSDIFNIKGEGFTVGGASASGNVGIVKGYQLIKAGILDVCMVVGAAADLSPAELQAFYNIGAMGGKKFRNSPKEASRPFDEEHEGFIYGQASASLILESSESANKREISTLAQLLGGVIVLDSNHLSNPNVDGETRAMLNAISQSQLDASEIDYINAHGSSSPIGDETELEAIKNVFKENTSNIWVNSTKCITGHCLYSAGIVEAISGIIQMTEEFIHPNINLNKAIADGFRFSEKKSVEAKIKTFISNSFGFGGINTSIILRK